MHQIQSIPKRGYTVNEFSKAFGPGRTKIYEMINSGELRSVIIGGRRIIPADEGERLLAAPESTKLEPAA